jgi:Na+/H+ antiporter NhaC
LLTTFVLGIVIFVDDYLNVLSIGVCMKGVYDKKKIPREALAYMLDSTAAPVCVLLPFSTWAVFYASLFYEQDCISSAGFASGIDAYTHAIPFCFYPIITLVIVLLFSLGWMPKLGGMKKAYERVEKTGKVYSDASRKYNHEEYKGYEEDGNIWDFIIPMAVLVGVAVVTSDVLVAVVLAIFACFIIYVPRKIVKFDDFFNIVAKGFADMIPVCILLTVAFAAQSIMDEMGLASYIIENMTPLLSASTFPVLSFILVAALGFTTGSFWGMCAVVTPIIFPLAAALGANPVLVMGAVVSGGAFGSHACFYGDATVLASTGACIDNMEHTISQLPYVLIASVITVAAYLVCGFVM